MRMRKKPNLDLRMENCSDLLVASPETNQSIWRALYPAFSEIQLEIGCGKGRFTAETAAKNPDILLLAVEKVQSAMVMAMERVRDAGLTNVRFIDADAAHLGEMFSPGEITTIYLNFCDPWPKSRDAKFRLTAPSFLRSYADVLPLGGAIHFKTDNLPLFTWSKEMLEQESWALRSVTLDLHANGPVGIMTDYEAKFYSEGVQIKRLEAVKTEWTKDTSAGVPPRLRNAALADAR
ncbi:MAG: tRNA (guanosine(46)-N7)-methyltransferase TrmB, partial [Oscillospiraceae bacterium]|nr:tRNA (guanosine(46)-N7)-methyltransferase TrmB [Oscillospiraceae bacterium]